VAVTVAAFPDALPALQRLALAEPTFRDYPQWNHEEARRWPPKRRTMRRGPSAMKASARSVEILIRGRSRAVG
jgi:hypothetical protein